MISDTVAPASRSVRMSLTVSGRRRDLRPNFTPRRRAQPVGRRQHNPGAPDVLLGAVAVIDDRLQALAISRAQIDGDASTHPADSHHAKAMGIPTRTLTSASIH